MSHIVKCEVRMKNHDVAKATAEQFGYTAQDVEDYRFFDGHTFSGLGIDIPGFRYKVVANRADGTVVSDTYNGQWGNPAKIDELVNKYSNNVAMQWATEQGYASMEASDGTLEIYAGDRTIRMANGIIDVLAGTGQSCESLTESLEAAIGGRISQTLKDNYFEIAEELRA